MARIDAQKVDEVRSQGTRAVLGALVHELTTLRSQQWGNLWGYIFIAPAVLMYLIFQAWPILRGLFMAFSDYRWLIPATHGLSGFNGLDNWVEMFQDSTFWNSFLISVRFSAIYLPLTLIVSLFAAVMISRVRNGVAAGAFRVIVYMPVIVPISISMLLWVKLFDPQLGYLNTLLRDIGVQNPPNWLGSPNSAPYAMILPTIWAHFGSWALLFLIGIYNINHEIYEAAVVDGANAWHQFRSVTVPLLKPVFALVLVTGSGILGVTEEAMVLFEGTTGGPAESALTTGVYIYRVAFIHGDMRMGYAAAISLFLGVVNMLITLVIFKTLRTERQ
jgi:multiple sugar transport system permease protein